LVLIENLEYADFINSSPWNYHIILLLRSKNLSQYIFKFFKKKKLYFFSLFPDFFWESLLKILKIKNSRLFILENYFKIKKKFQKKKF